MSTGILYASLAYVCWGIFPLYFKALQSVSPFELLAHRVAWSLVFVGIVLAWRHHVEWLGPALRNRALMLRFAASATVISINWFTFIWAVVNGRVVEASLGYFINPLVNVLVGWLVLHERLRAGQWMAVGLAAAGVAWLTYQAGHPPWIALVLACSFASYGLLRKTAPLGALEGLAMETLLLGPIAIAGLVWMGLHGQSRFVDGTPGVRALLVAAGPITAVPLLLFAAGARRIPFSTLGLLQYIGPTLQLLLGVLLYQEPFSSARAAGFAAIWAALVLYTAEGLLNARRRSAVA